jgi:hypothetical protein
MAMGNAATHTQFSRGKKIRIVFRDGTVWVRKFLQRRGRTIEVADEAGAHSEIEIRHIKTVGIYKQQARSHTG